MIKDRSALISLRCAVRCAPLCFVLYCAYYLSFPLSAIDDIDCQADESIVCIITRDLYELILICIGSSLV
jgi:hypothetical protein